MPTMWQWLLAADKRLDLSDPDRGQDWFDGPASWYALSLPEDARESLGTGKRVPWTAAIRQIWTEGIRAFRVVAHDLKGAKTRRDADPDEFDAGKVFRDYLALLRLRVDPAGVARPEARPPRPISFSSWDEVAEASVSMFFQRLFLSLVELDSSVSSVCGRCGRPLKTKTGRVSRAQHCPSCKVWAWNHRHDEKVRRGRWAKDKRKSRKMRKRDTKNKGG